MMLSDGNMTHSKIQFIVCDSIPQDVHLEESNIWNVLLALGVLNHNFDKKYMEFYNYVEWPGKSV